LSWSRTLKARQMLRAQIEAGEDVAFLFSDLRGFSTYTARKGDQAAYQLSQVHERILREQITEYGIVVKSLGDGIMAAFEVPVRAIRAAVGIQQAIRERNQASPGDPIDAGIGVSSGTPVMTDIDFIGHSVNLAQRLSGLAKGGQILVTEGIRSRVSLPDGLHYARLGARDLPGVGVESPVEVVWLTEVARISDANDQVTLILTGRGTIVVELAKDTKQPIRDALKQLRGAKAAKDGVMSAALQRTIAAVGLWVVRSPSGAADFAREQPVDRLKLTMRRGGMRVEAANGSMFLAGVDRAEGERFFNEAARLQGVTSPRR
jgi:class 3 adenylate cyclase